MLILSRKCGQVIQIGDEVTIEVSRVKGNRVQLSINCPTRISIVRSELLNAEKRPPAEVGAMNS